MARIRRLQQKPKEKSKSKRRRRFGKSKKSWRKPSLQRKRLSLITTGIFRKLRRL